MTSNASEYECRRLERIDPTEYTDFRGMLLGGDVTTPFVSPPSSKILKHCWQELVNAAKQADYRPEWHVLANLLAEAGKAVESYNQEAVLEVFFQIGQLSGKLSMPSDRQYLEGMKAKLINLKREQPLVEKNLRSKACKFIAKNLAQQLWKRDTGEKIRVAAMADLVWAAMFEQNTSKEILDCLPDRAERIRPWIREVAPGYARKGGAPKKGKIILRLVR